MGDFDVGKIKENVQLLWYVKKFYPNIQIKSSQRNVTNAICPFHEDRDTASLALYSNGSWKCFGCGQHGDIIQFVMNMEGIDFMDACKLICSNTGIPFAENNISPEWRTYMNVMNSHIIRYFENLKNNGEAMNYLINERKVSPDMISKFRLGLVPDDEYTRRNDIGNISGRISIPLFEHSIYHPNVLGAAYRDFHGVMPKYINDTNKDGREGQNPALNGVFIKSNILYGLPQAKKTIIKAGHVILVEGYFDVISMHQSLIENVVGVMGTSLSESQMTALKSLTSNVMLFLDGDDAGIKGMCKMATQLYSKGFNVMIIVAKNKMDPDDVCKAHNFNYAKIINDIKHGMKDAMNYIISLSTEQFKNTVSIEQRKVIKKMEPIIMSISNSMEREFYMKKLYDELMM